MDASAEHLRYSCGSVAGLGSCVEGFTAQADVKDWTTYSTLGTLSVVCAQERDSAVKIKVLHISVVSIWHNELLDTASMHTAI